MKHYTKIVVIFLGLLGLLSSCLKRDNFPIVPYIELVSFSVDESRDSGSVVLLFQDGDGDVGTTDTGVFNIFGTLQELQNGSWEEISLALDLNFTINRDLTPQGQDKNLEGELEIRMTPFSGFYDASSPFDTIRYSFYIEDQAKNQSNTIFTTLYVKP